MKPNPTVVTAAYSVLKRVAKERCTMSYSALSDKVPGLSRRGPSMVATLIAVAECSWAERHVLLPVLAVKAGRNGLPSSGFYESLTTYRPEDDQSDPRRAARRERERVYAAYPPDQQ
ncbi:hypothetical protein SAMN04489832_0804 [Micromonospora cremea]|uniref:Uncharacterized protein n=1 Tax=Micromonospora cremea TaxID=709881 RepID=A0A1N5UCG0_9ACTN|nr:hypothetical protein SAMN04489832_0804 [Micromonospora cremea]